VGFDGYDDCEFGVGVTGFGVFWCLLALALLDGAAVFCGGQWPARPAGLRVQRQRETSERFPLDSFPAKIPMQRQKLLAQLIATLLPWRSWSDF